MEQNKPEYLDDSPEAASVDESRRGHYESEIKKAIDNVKREADYAALEARCAGLERERRLEEALTPSAETKAAYIGEFRWAEEREDEDGETYVEFHDVPWTTIKEIMKAIKARAALADTTTVVVQP